MHIVIGLLGVACGALLIKYRETVGDMIGESDFINKIGGIHNVLIVVGVIIFFWSLAYMTGTLGILFGPLVNALPFVHKSVPTDVPITNF